MNKNANIVLRLFEHAAAQPGNPAIVFDEGVVAYGQLRKLMAAVAHHLAAHGIRQGDVVGVTMAQNPLHVVTLLALAQLGAVSLPLHIAISAERRLLAARRFGAKCAVSGRLEMALPGLPFISLAQLNFEVAGATDLPVAEVTDNTALRVALSSGTSGDPKGMIFSHGLMRLRAEGPDQELSRFSRTLLMDLNFAVGYSQAFRALRAGAVLVIPTTQAPDNMLRTMVSHAVTHAFLSPSQAHGLCQEVRGESIHCPTLVCLRIGGGRMSPSLLHSLNRKITPNVFAMYGSTEGGNIAIASPELLAKHPDTAGLAREGVQLEIVDGDDQPVTDTVTGAVRLRTPWLVESYFADDARNARYFRGGWFYPGDEGRLDASGLLYIEGRSDELLNVGGSIVNPLEVEEIVTAQPGVLQAGAFVWINATGDELLAAAVVLAAGGSLAEIESAVLTQLGPLAPQHYFTVESLPNTLNGKLRRVELAGWFAGLAAT